MAGNACTSTPAAGAREHTRLPSRPVFPPNDLLPARRVWLITAAACLLILLARPASAQGTIVLAWDSNPEPEVIGYRVYVGEQPGAYTATYDVEWYQTSFGLQNPRAGMTYYLAVAARAAGGVIGPRSAEIFVTATGDAGPGPPRQELCLGCDIGLEGSGAQPLSAASPADEAGVVCVAGNDADCYTARVVAKGVGPVSSLLATGPGRLLFIEHGRTIRVLSGGGGAPATALEVSRPDVVLTGLALDPAYAHTGLVFVGESAPRRDGGRDASIVRYREVGGTFGEAATVVAGLPLGASDHAPFTLDLHRNIYIAVPGPAHDAPAADPYAGHLVRFTPDGRAAPLEGSLSPILARGPDRPAALTWDLAVPGLWIGGSREESWPGLARLDAPAFQPPEWTGARIDPAASGASGRLVSMAVSTATGPGGNSRQVLLVDDEGRLYRAQVTDAAQPAGLEQIPLDGLGLGKAVAVASGSPPQIYLVVRDAASGGHTILALAP